MSEPTYRDAWNREYDAKIAAQTEALAEYGFGPAFNVGDGGPLGMLVGVTQAATCDLCGAMVRTTATPVHHRWHFPTEEA